MPFSKLSQQVAKKNIIFPKSIKPKKCFGFSSETLLQYSIGRRSPDRNYRSRWPKKYNIPQAHRTPKNAFGDCEVELCAHLQPNALRSVCRNKFDIQNDGHGRHDCRGSGYHCPATLGFIIQSGSKRVARQSCARIYDPTLQNSYAYLSVCQSVCLCLSLPLALRLLPLSLFVSVCFCLSQRCLVA